MTGGRGDAEADADAELSALLEGAVPALKVFPLPDVVVFPGAPAPFHIFEPRYRSLVADALDAERMLAVATIRPGHEAEANPALAASPPLLPIAGAGFLEGDEKLPDGRYHVVFRGLARVRLVEELGRGRPYREFRTEIVDDQYPPEGPESLRPSADTLVQLVLDLAARLPPESGARDLAAAVQKVEAPGSLADLVAAAVITEGVPRYRVMEAIEVKQRLAIVVEEVAGVILMLSQGGGGARA
jgi:Lon protease-like protein